MKKYINISDVLWFQEGPGVRNTQYTTDGVKLLNVTNLINGNVDTTNTNRYISKEEAYGKYKHFLADEGDLVIASSGIKVEYFDKKMGFIRKEQLPLCMNTSTIRFKVTDEKRLSIRYFMYYLKSNHFKEQLGKQITGSAQLNFGPSHLKKMVFPLIEMEEQAKIIDKLDTIYDIEYKMRTELKLYDQLASSLFIEMFGDIHNNKNYDYTNIEEITSVLSGGTPDRKENKYWEGGTINWVKTTELNNNIIIETEEKITNLGLENSSAKIIPPQSILIAMYGQGKTRGMTGYLEVSSATNQACACILPSRYINQKYLWNYLILSYDKLRSMAKGGNQPNLNVMIIKKFPVLIPPMNLQEKFVQSVSSIDKSKYSSFSHLSA